MSEQKSYIVSDSLTEAWEAAIALLIGAKGGEVSLLCVTLEKFSGRLPAEDFAKRDKISAFLREHELKEIHTTANTVFPSSLWNESCPRDVLYERYRRILPRLRKCSANRYGLYFERMIAFGWDPSQGDEFSDCVNQLESIIQFYESGNVRRSALQVSIGDPRMDVVNQRRRGFPCLQQVSFRPDGDHGWSVTGYYPTQYIDSRGYGNYLGLARLGDFVAHALGRQLTQVNCVANVALIGAVAKRDLKVLLRDLSSPAAIVD